MGYIFWTIFAFILATGEMIAPALITIWFAIAAGFTIIVSLLFNSLLIEIIVFTCLSILLLIFTRPYVKKYLSKNKDEFDSSMLNADVVIVKIIESEKEEKIYDVKFKGTIWTGLSKEKFSLNDTAKIEGFKGNKILIKSKNI